MALVALAGLSVHEGRHGACSLAKYWSVSPRNFRDRWERVMRLLSFVLLSLAVGVVALGCSSSDGGGTGGSGGQPGPQWTIDAGALKLRVTESPWNMTFFDAEGNPVLVELPDSGDGPSGSLAMHLGPPPPGNGQQAVLPPVVDGVPATPPERASGWVHATAVETSAYEGEAYVATIATSDSDRKLEFTAAQEGDGVINITVRPASAEGVQALGVGFVAEQGERFVGFGERSNAVNQAGWALEHYVADGPYYDGEEYAVMGELLPDWGTRWRPHATYFQSLGSCPRVGMGC